MATNIPYYGKIMTMRATIRQVAELAQVSPVTVSNVLRGLDHRAAPETRQRVLDAARQLNYIPVQPPTVQNRRNETRIISLVFEHTDLTKHDIDLRTYDGIVEGARHHNYDLLTLLREQPEWTTEGDDVRFLDRRSDGFIFAVSMKGEWERALETVSRHNIPAVTCYRRDVPEDVAWADVDNYGAIERAVQHLVKRGHKRIAYLSGPPTNYNAADRLRAFEQAMKSHEVNLCDEWIVQGYGDGFDIQEDAIAAVPQLGVSAVVCFNDSLALSLWDKAEIQGLKIPEDISIIGIDDRREAVQRGLTTMAHSFSDVGRLALEAWVELKSGREAHKCSKIAPFIFIERSSTRYI
jgi:DNA-binding LacI/PurR family transcriptional regulator